MQIIVIASPGTEFTVMVLDEEDVVQYQTTCVYDTMFDTLGQIVQEYHTDNISFAGPEEYVSKIEQDYIEGINNDKIFD